MSTSIERTTDGAYRLTRRTVDGIIVTVYSTLEAALQAETDAWERHKAAPKARRLPIGWYR